MIKLVFLIFMSYLFFRILGRMLGTMLGGPSTGGTPGNATSYRNSREKDISDKVRIIKD